jgi:hypothetical protein
MVIVAAEAGITVTRRVSANNAGIGTTGFLDSSMFGAVD